MVAILQLKASKLIVYFVSFTVVIFTILVIDSVKVPKVRNNDISIKNKTCMQCCALGTTFLS